MHKTLRSRILFYFLIVSLCGILLTSFSVLWGFEDHFNNYLRENREKNISLIEEEAKREYKETGNLVSEQMAGLMHEQAMTESLFYQVYDESNQLLVDTTMMLGMMGSMGMGQSEAILNKDDYLVETYKLSLDDQTIGSIKVYFPNSLLEEDFSFLNTIKQNIYIAAIITIILSIIFSMMFSKRLVAGFNSFSNAVYALKEHKWHTQVPVEELTGEMQPLAHSLNNLAKSLSKEETLRKQFTADLAHELRTPLATLRSQIEAYQDGIWEPTPERLQQSHSELMRLVRLVNELERLLAAENPQIKLQKKDIEGGQVVALVGSQFNTAYQEKGVNLHIVKPEKEYWFKADKDRVIQVITNILNNALQYTPVGKNVTICILDKAGYVGFSVKDEGVGIKEEDLPFVYERFYRGDKSRDRKTGGIGIGLSIVKALVDAHQGEIKIESELGIGTKVTVYFPKK